MLPRKLDLARRSAWARYSVAIVGVFLGWLAREAITPTIGPSALPFIFFFPAVALATWFGGLGPGVTAIVVSAIGANWFFLEPIRAWSTSKSRGAAFVPRQVCRTCAFMIFAILTPPTA